MSSTLDFPSQRVPAEKGRDPFQWQKGAANPVLRVVIERVMQGFKIVALYKATVCMDKLSSSLTTCILFIRLRRN